MSNRHFHLKGNPIPWLLEKENPSVRYWTLIDILGHDQDDDLVCNARQAISQQPIVQELFSLQHPEGYWGEDETKPYTAQGAVGVLSLLHMLGVPPDDRTRAGCESFLHYSQNENGGFSLVKTIRSGIFPCTTGEHLPFLVYFGMGEAPQVRKAFSYLVESMAMDKTLDCGRYQHRDCLWGAIAALRGLTVLPEDIRGQKSDLVIQRLAEALLSADYDFQGEHKRWLTFGVPRAWDLRAALLVLAAHGYGQDPRFTSLLDLFLEKQDDQGRWLCGSVSKTWPLEKRNRPSKWVTLDALRVLRLLGFEFLAEV